MNKYTRRLMLCLSAGAMYLSIISTGIHTSKTTISVISQATNSIDTIFGDFQNYEEMQQEIEQQQEVGEAINDDEPSKS